MGLLRADLYKTIRYPLTRWLIVGLLVLALLRGLVLPPDPDLPWNGLWSTGFVTVALVMLAAVVAGQEFSEDTFRSFASRGVPRWWLLVSQFATLLLVGAVLLVVFEGLAVLLNIRSELRWADLGRAWLSLWPYVSLTMLLTVAARNGGLALVIGVLMMCLDAATGMFMGTMATFPDVPQFRLFSHRGLVGTLFQWSLSFNSTNWTYMAGWQRAPTPLNMLLEAMPHSALYSALVLASYTLLGLCLSVLIVYRRDVTEVVQGKKGLFGLARGRARPAEARGRRARERLPTWTGRGPLLVRLGRAHMLRIGRTSLVKIGAAVSLLFPLTLWWVSRASQAAGLQDVLFSPSSEGGSPMAFAISLMMVGPLATVFAILVVSQDLTLGTRRAELTRGVSRLQTIVAQSLALALILGAAFTLLMVVTLFIGASVAGTWAVKDAAVTILVSLLGAGIYVGAVQIGGAVTGTPLGAMLFGLGFLVADWLAILTPTLMIEDPGLLLNLGRHAVFANTFALAKRGQIVGVGVEWPHLSAPAAILLLLGYAVAGHTLAVLFARWRDA